MPANDLWAQAWDRLPLPLLLEKIGDGLHVPKGSPCPFCQSKGGKWGLFKRGSRSFFKCHSPECVANDPPGGHDEIGYLSIRHNLSRTDAAKEYLHLALPEALIQEFATEESHFLAPPAPGRRPEPTSPPLNPWDALWRKLTLTDADREKLKKNRGLSDKVIDQLGFRSSNRGNLPALQALMEEWPQEQLVAQGIVTVRRGVAEPNFQLYGFGPSGKDDANGKPEFDLTEPILIPYLDQHGVPFYLRPHKGGVSKPVPEDLAELSDDDEPAEARFCQGHVYCPYILADLIAEHDGLCVFTEGEFKAAALYQAGIPALACPGISFPANAAFRRELVGLLEAHHVTRLVIIYDNEDKHSTVLPDGAKNRMFKEDPRKRYETIVFAKYAQKLLRSYCIRAGGHVTVGWLPDEHRVNGKADFDGILAKLVAERGPQNGLLKAREVFEEAIAGAEDGEAQLELFPTLAQRIIAHRLDRLTYKPRVLSGGYPERELAAKLWTRDEHGKPIDPILAAAFTLCESRYFERRAPTDKARGALLDALKENGEAVEKFRGQVRDDPANEEYRQRLHILNLRRTALFERLKGIPEDKSTFTISCEYKIHRADGHVDRLIRIHDSKESDKKTVPELRRITAEELGSAREFRVWCLSTGQGSFKGGEILLQDLTEDWDHESFQQDIHEIVCFGYDEHSKIWFFGDCAIVKGQKLLPDKGGIIWHEGVGYTLDTSIDERGGSSFSQGSPLLTKPHLLETIPEEQLATILPTPRQTGGGAKHPDETLGGIARLFKTFTEDVYDSIGSYEGWLAVSMMVAYAAAPELVKLEGHPSAWIVGRMSGGKTTLMRFLCRFWGFRDLHDGTRLDKTTTANGVSRVLAQYSCLPVSLDEFSQALIDPNLIEILKASFNRVSGQKALADYSTKTRSVKPKTTPLIGGESSPSNAAARSRYVHITAAAGRRLGDGPNRLTRMQAYVAHLHHLGHWLLLNRAEFLERFMMILDVCRQGATWRARIEDPRVRYVHGVAYAAMQAITQMLQIPAFDPSPECAGLDEKERTITGFHNWILSHAAQAGKDVTEETFLSQFWREIIINISSKPGKIHPKFFAVRGVLRDEKTGALKIIHDEPYAYQVYSQRIEMSARKHDDQINVCYIAFAQVHNDYALAHRQREGEKAPLSLADLRREMEKEPWWFANPKDSNRRHVAKMDGHAMTCIVLSLERKDRSDSPASPFLFGPAEDLIQALIDVPEQQPTA